MTRVRPLAGSLLLAAAFGLGACSAAAPSAGGSAATTAPASAGSAAPSIARVARRRAAADADVTLSVSLGCPPATIKVRMVPRRRSLLGLRRLGDVQRDDEANGVRDIVRSKRRAVFGERPGPPPAKPDASRTDGNSSCDIGVGSISHDPSVFQRCAAFLGQSLEEARVGFRMPDHPGHSESIHEPIKSASPDLVDLGRATVCSYAQLVADVPEVCEAGNRRLVAAIAPHLACQYSSTRSSIGSASPSLGLISAKNAGRDATPSRSARRRIRIAILGSSCRVRMNHSAHSPKNVSRSARVLSRSKMTRLSPSTGVVLRLGRGCWPDF